MSAADAYARAFAGAPLATFTRPGFAPVDSVAVRPAALDGAPLVGAAEQPFTRLIAYARHFAALGAPEPGDRVSFAGRDYAVENVDGLSRSVGGVTLAFVLDVRG